MLLFKQKLITAIRFCNKNIMTQLRRENLKIYNSHKQTAFSEITPADWTIIKKKTDEKTDVTDR